MFIIIFNNILSKKISHELLVKSYLLKTNRSLKINLNRTRYKDYSCYINAKALKRSFDKNLEELDKQLLYRFVME